MYVNIYFRTHINNIHNTFESLLQKHVQQMYLQTGNVSKASLSKSALLLNEIQCCIIIYSTQSYILKSKKLIDKL